MSEKEPGCADGLDVGRREKQPQSSQTESTVEPVPWKKRVETARPPPGTCEGSERSVVTWQGAAGQGPTGRTAVVTLERGSAEVLPR